MGVSAKIAINNSESLARSCRQLNHTQAAEIAVTGGKVKPWLIMKCSLNADGPLLLSCTQERSTSGRPVQPMFSWLWSTCFSVSLPPSLRSSYSFSLMMWYERIYHNYYAMPLLIKQHITLKPHPPTPKTHTTQQHSSENHTQLQPNTTQHRTPHDTQHHFTHSNTPQHNLQHFAHNTT